MAEKDIHLLPKVLVNSVPKSGTHLLMQIVLGIPGMTITPSWFYPGTFNDIKNMKPGQMGPAHLHYSDENAEKLQEWNIKVLFISRDLRDIATSLVHFVLEDKWGKHPLHPYLKHHLKSHEERLLAVIRGVAPSNPDISDYGLKSWPNIYEYTKRQYGWLNAPGICCLTFEDLVRSERSQDQTIMKIIRYLWKDLKHLSMTKHELLRTMKNNINPSESGTFRKGKAGSWKEEFTEAHKEAFKEVTGDLLIRLRYEKDSNW